MKSASVFASGVVLSLSLQLALSAQCVVDISSGFDAAAGAVLTEGDPDDSYTVDDGSGPQPALTGGAGQGFPVPTWVPNTETSLWVSNAADSNADPGTYTYEIRFDLAADGDPASLSIIGSYAVDNGLTDLVVNGTSVSVPAAAFTAMVEFPAGTAVGMFQEGENVVQFVTSNAGDAPNPAGLRVDACVGVAEIPVAEARAIDISTGFDDAAVATIENGAADDEYVLTGPEGSGIGPVPATLVNDTVFPIPPWIASSVQSKWIGMEGADSNGPPGVYVYATEVEIAADADAGLAMITGSFAADDSLSDVLVNGNSLGISAAGFGALTPFPPGAGSGLFVNGANTVEFLVTNGGEAENPTGLRVDGQVEFAEPAPESLFDLSSGFESATGELIANNEADDSWVVVGPEGSDIGPVSATVVNDAAFPIGPWIGSSARSKWIGVEGESSNGPPGEYRFSIAVVIPDGVDASRAVISAAASADNGGVDIIINGASTGVTFTGDFATLPPLPADVGLGLFQAGENTVDILVNNAGDTINPIGFRIEGDVILAAEGGAATQLVSDVDQDGVLSIGDIVGGVSLLFPGFNLLGGVPPSLPCESDQGNLTVLDFNGDGAANLADLLGAAMYLFEGGGPPALGAGCVFIPGCEGPCA